MRGGETEIGAENSMVNVGAAPGLSLEPKRRAVREVFSD